MKRALSLVVVTAIGLALSASAAADVARTPDARTILHGRDYRFCNDPGPIGSPESLAHCELLDEASACPAYARRCAEALRRLPNVGACSPAPGAAPVNFGLAQIVGMLAIAVALALVIWLVRAVMRAQASSSRKAGAVPVDAASVLVQESRAAGPSADVLAVALRAAEAGDFARASFLLHAALLRGLEERGWVRLDAVYTTGDYVRTCSDARGRTWLREVARSVEAVRFGQRQATRETFERVRIVVEPVVRGVGVLLLVLLAAGASACGSKVRGHVAEHAPQGHAAIVELLSAAGLRATPWEQSIDAIPDTERVLVVDTDWVEFDADEWSAVATWVDRGGALVVAGGDQAALTKFGFAPESLRGLPDARLIEELGRIKIRVRSSVRGVGVDGESEVLAVSSDAEGAPAYARRRSHGRGSVTFLGGTELVQNVGLAAGTNGEAAVALFRHVANGHPILFAVAADGVASSPVGVLRRAGALPLFLQAMAALVLLFVMQGRHFATPRDPSVSRHRAFVEHVRALGSLYRRARASRTAAHAYGRLVIERMRERFGVREASIAEAIAARAGEPVESVRATLERASDLEGPGTPDGVRRDLGYVRKLNAWYRRMG